MNEQHLSDGHEILFEQFGSNFWYVADLYDSYLNDKTSVSEYWRKYFDNLKKAAPAPQKGRAKPPSPPVEKRQAEIKPTGLQQAEKKEALHATSSSPTAPPSPVGDHGNFQLITGVGARIIENMTGSLSIPTATSQRTISVKLLEENRRIINQFLQRTNQGKISFTHIVAYAIVRALRLFPSMNNSFSMLDGKPYLVQKKEVNFGLAIDIEKKDGSRSLIVPNIKQADKMNFYDFRKAYDDVIKRSRTGKIEPSDFQATTISLTNPGTVGTVSSIPRLMTGQGVIIAIGVIDYPAQYQAMSRSTIAELGIGKVMNITSTYDHRVIQGAESGLFLKLINDLLLGEANFYEDIFRDFNIPQKPVSYREDTPTKAYSELPGMENVEKQARILQLINIYRVRGHLIANLNPLGVNSIYHPELDPANLGFTIWDYDRKFITGGLGGKETGTLREILDILQQTYCDKVGIEYMHIQHPEEKSWLQSRMEPIRNHYNFSPELKKRMLWELVIAEEFEHFLHTKYVGHKRFSLEGSETVIPVLDYLINLAAEDSVQEIFMGMAHRGRLNVLANIIGKSYEKIFTEFEGNIDPNSVQGSGDVKYHLGASGKVKAINGNVLTVSVASNPSHLEWVNPVVEGIVRAKQKRANDVERKVIIPLLIHGDAAFAGQGVVAETLNLSQLKGYRTGGTIHLIINNQIGFTTDPAEARSSIYATDVAKMVQAPIFHVNGDDPEAALWVTRLAYEYRQKFSKDVVIDLFGYRRHGHNEGDDPAYTQPLMYKNIKEHPSVKELYKQKLIAEKLLSPDEEIEKRSSVNECLNESFDKSANDTFDFYSDLPLAVPEDKLFAPRENAPTSVSRDEILSVVEKITSLPGSFVANPKLSRMLTKRRELISNPQLPLDWAYAEALAFGTLLLEGTPIRLSGQDSARGTFSQRHLILSDINTGEELLLLNQLVPEKASMEALDSLLSEAAVLGFELGYSVADPLSLVLWEAQFGDFANGAQVIIDNFLASAYSKWKLPNSLVLLLPHGYEGQGPEHSSARIERFLSLAADDNMSVCNVTTPAQYFHLLRRQVKHNLKRPLVEFTPKSLLRLPEARSILTELTNGKFFKVLDDYSAENKNSVSRLILLSGKLYYEVIAHKIKNKITDTAVIRLEELYPFPLEDIQMVIDSYPNARKLVWAQEEPKNMGAWSFIFQKSEDFTSQNIKLYYSGRNESASPASGSLKVHQKEQEELIRKAFSM
ncbi:MAG: multifunctional oxoglutarate decarboxylase/oxoglutarate dehydrogenase thiamine pyrophosphate-binding subunit/dihydrolipoyllysine-residue succinyltransferase subunit [Ignavibacteria bacterium]|jgi:2-oxoglutarate dehydrogenase E1 component|nr:multifunctional oxoglutarate decarboxylase/oxoglutarate dehydrogenase thiamine pyrophosphate-binding subunit/dihydrolipoyllysine-residue succinyltransferase subunit [Ignavibacteria bacterium]MCU7504021.1 multifunctional oxoglutarate decarboxylase/oxoglutarate dehydrogenase thiamine pyrophosphate-binding subunit/dihydrolipoyllysine-residue succinyltransferase subunit [Ignavibacteria bacterium]MCU7515393.1 multifunctional oxoglutarate decarboxylase/oxoglutarate dehydrogenase thiamine pyrophospha